MPDDPMEALRRATAQGNQQSHQRRVQGERKAQDRSRKTRRFLRWSLLGFATVGISSFFAASSFASMGLYVFGVLSLLLSCAAGLGLILMGGLMPIQSRGKLSQRERRLLDN
jgi:hypothetical protein